MKDKPNPGSEAALNQGCTCHVLDNGHGSPALGEIRGWWISEGCPVHCAADTPPITRSDPLGKIMLDGADKLASVKEE